MTRQCKTPGCGRSTPNRFLAYCTDCFPVVWRTGAPPVIKRKAA